MSSIKRGLMVIASTTEIVGASRSPLVTAESAYSLVKDSVVLVKDVTLFAHEKIVSYIPDEPRENYEDLLSKAYAQIRPFYDNLLAKTQPYTSKAVELVTRVWGLLEAKTSPFLNSIMVDFERRYPSQAGKIGGSLADKAATLIVVWLILGFVIRTVRAVVFGTLCGRGKRSSSVGYTLGGRKSDFPSSKKFD